MSDRAPKVRNNKLRARQLGIEAQHKMIVFMRKDCPVCRAEGFTGHTRVRLDHGGKMVIATLYHVTSDLLGHGEMGVTNTVWDALALSDGASVAVSHPAPLVSLSWVRGKVFGKQLDERAYREIIADVVAGRYSDIELSAFITACSAQPMDISEIKALTRAMVDAGERLDWGGERIVDKHCIGGLPGNRTTPIIAAIVAAQGLMMPKTSSRAITSPAGTADTMETLAPVNLSLAEMRRVVEQEGACIVWGGTVRLSPADDILIRVERRLDLDGEAQLVASVLSKKIAAGATDLVLDLPVGPSAKLRSNADAQTLSDSLLAVAEAFDLRTTTVFSDGTQPVGRGVGPALEGRDVLAVLKGAPDAPLDLRERALSLAGLLLELAGKASAGEGTELAAHCLDSGEAWAKFQRICEAQGGLREPPVARHQVPLCAAGNGRVIAIDNRVISRIAKLAGAPGALAAGLDLHVRVGDEVHEGEPLYTIHAETAGELGYAQNFAAMDNGVIVGSIA